MSAAAPALAHSSPRDDPQTHLTEAIAVRGYDDGTHQMRVAPRHEITVAIPLHRDDGSTELLTGHRVQHNLSCGPGKGGMQHGPDVKLTRSGLGHLNDLEVRPSRRPYGGAKGGVQIDRRRFNRAELERVTCRYASEITPWIGPTRDIPAPDIGTDEERMAWMMDTYSVASGQTVLGVVTGKPIGMGDSLRRAAATSLGIAYIALAGALRHPGCDPVAKAAVQVFGKVGRGAARFLCEAGVTVTGVSDQCAGVWSPSGPDLPALEDRVDATGSVMGFLGAVPIENDELQTLDVCSCRRRSKVPSTPTPSRPPTSRQAWPSKEPTARPPRTPLGSSRSAASLSCPTSSPMPVASSWPTSSGPSQTGHIGSARLRYRCASRRMAETWDQVLSESESEQRGLALRAAAICPAVRRVAEAHRQRGLYP